MFNYLHLSSTDLQNAGISRVDFKMVIILFDANEVSVLEKDFVRKYLDAYIYVNSIQFQITETISEFQF